MFSHFIVVTPSLTHTEVAYTQLLTSVRVVRTDMLNVPDIRILYSVAFVTISRDSHVQLFSYATLLFVWCATWQLIIDVCAVCILL